MNNEGNTAVGFFKGIRKNIVPVSPNQKKEFRSLSRPIPRPRPRRTFHASMRIREQTETDTENEDESSSVLEYSAGTSSGTSFIRSELSLGDPSTPQDSLMELFGNGYWPESEDGQTPSSGERREASSQRSSPCSETDVRACSSTCYSENNLDHSSIDALSSSVHETGGPGCAQTSSQDNCNESCTHSQGNPDCLSFGAILGSEGDFRYMRTRPKRSWMHLWTMTIRRPVLRPVQSPPK
ncbi:uncharacterized protein LOC111082342 [Drosophila obscura]|uniref:uncharacterized protein LOC111082342 n=1 Tax=Drosophila obscura TaxID=7282 RepID=UPI001BB1773D|nr:uncharacterized protein LOC111082342 [Drosophila obscura]XP_022234243.2 uncharacterized protein LOC111082342 [Drosophila obscura]